ncbi:hypothetical protein PENTCL1PPCAC_12526 [Pristionchus entomophagus]|uniref:Protein arginine N-methyltransferase n=1 Tax=Pristionchus entomophagus TaxID=358040 RepID=A0AAV5TEM9_9BILA|nr:hypothetical protein PENTCL1PPCAC_12526 [Pristionchus entomophagus]
MAPKKKNKKVKTSSSFDYEALIPSCLSGEDRGLVKKFLMNELATSEERDAALAVFAAAVIEERNDESDSAEEAKVSELRTMAAGTLSRAEAERRKMEQRAELPANDASTSSSPYSEPVPRLVPRSYFDQSGPSGPSLPSGQSGSSGPAGRSGPSLPTIADHIAALKIGSKKKKLLPKAPPPVREVDFRESWEDETIVPSIPPRTGPVLDTQEKRVNKEVADEVRKNVNVGWWASPYDADEKTDTRIAEYAQSLGGELYNFISYPIGGMARSKTRITSDGPIPPINLPDLQLANPHWETYVAGHPSLWIDCDEVDADPWLALMSTVELEKELNYAHYLGLNTVVIELWHKNATALAGVIGKFLWTAQSAIKICIMLPTDVKLMDGEEGDEREVWEVWADFRAMIGNFAGDRLCCGIKLMEDLDDEFVDPLSLQRWQAEPIIMFTMETNVFTTNERTGGADLGPAHTALLETLWTSETMTAAVRGPLKDPRGARLQYAQAIRSIIGPRWLKKKLSKKPNFLDLNEVHYQDVIQKPLQPLADNLQSGVYNTFEADAPKYKYYGEAVELAVKDMSKKRGTGDIVLYVLGAGRGPLMSAAMAAEKRVNDGMGTGGPRIRMELVCVEKNENAVVTLNYLNASLWKGRVRIIQADMRELKEVATGLGLRRPDIIVSELLGSFGDNELSPECLDGCVDWLKEDTISIPQSYTSYCEPIASLSLYHSIKAQPTSYYFKGRQANGRRLTEQQPDGTYIQEFPQGREMAAMDMLYVVFLDKVVRQCEPKPFFTFTHPCFDKVQSERERWKVGQQWIAPTTQEIMGFACYFSARLYNTVTLSIVRGQETPDMLSWFPAVLPLREPLRVNKGDQLCFIVERCRDHGGVWYEWCALTSGADMKVPPKITEVQNVRGVSYYMRLITEKEKELEGKTPSPNKT